MGGRGLLRSAPWGLALWLGLAPFGGLGDGQVEAAPLQLRVGVARGLNSALLAANGPASLADDRGRILFRLGASEGWLVSPAPGGLHLTGPGGRGATLQGGAWLIPDARRATNLVFLHRRWYRGAAQVLATAEGITLINRVPLESYLYGVVPAEMPHAWPAAALRAQAVAARSYAMSMLGKHQARGYDLCATDDCQVYHGAAVEARSSNAAVEATQGQVLYANGKILAAYFCASAGGYTENSEEVWVQRLGHIRAVPDFDQNSPHYEWRRELTNEALAAGLARQGVQVGELLQVRVVERSTSGRVKQAEVVGTLGARRVSGEGLRGAAGLASTLFSLAPRPGVAPPGQAPTGPIPPSGFMFVGRGWGHGLGLSQWGAKAMGERGYAHTAILAHYYPNSQLRALRY